VTDGTARHFAEPELAEFEAEVARAAIALAAPGRRRLYRQVLVAYDGTPDARAALERVPALVASQGEVTVLTVIPVEAVGSNPDPITTRQRQWQWNCLVEATACLRASGIDPFIEAAGGNPSAVIYETAASLDADLVILGSGVQPTLERQLTCDTLVVRAHAVTSSRLIADGRPRHV